jgi:phosphoribosylanthranilate isomerase
MGVRVKICGLTRGDDAAAAVAAGADALGFVLWPGSKRAVTADAVRAMIATLPPLVATVGVFVDADPAEMLAIRAACGLSHIQLSGNEAPEVARALGPAVIKAFRAVPTDVADWPVQGVLADGAAPGQYGGTGHTAAEALLAALAPTGRMILAGGLTPLTVAAAVARWRPYAVDVASGVEAAPGIKDPALIQAFVAAAKAQ